MQEHCETVIPLVALLKELSEVVRRLSNSQYTQKPVGVVESSVGGTPAGVPSQGSFSYGSRNFIAFTFRARAFPTGPLRITVLIPIPYG